MKRRHTTPFARAAVVAAVAALALMPMRVPAQGTINFSTFVAGEAFSHVYGPQPGAPGGWRTGNSVTAYSPSTPTGDFPTGTTTYAGPLLGGSATGPTNQWDFTNGFLWTAQLWAVPGPNMPVANLQPVAQYTTTMRTGPNPGSAGFITPLSFSAANLDPGIPGAAQTGCATCQLRVWYNGGGTITSWSAAQYAGVPTGASVAFTVPGLGSVDGVPPPLPANLAGLQSFSLNTTPFETVSMPPPTVQSATANQAGGTCCFNWHTPPGQVCQIQYKTNVTQTNWNNLGSPVIVSNGFVQVIDGLTNSQRFYRLVVLP